MDSRNELFSGFKCVLLLFLAISSNEIEATDECSPRYFESDSYVCVCNATYCDTVSPWTKPEIGTVLSFTTSKTAHRFQKGTLPFNNRAGVSHCSKFPLDFHVSICVDSSNIRQEIVGFGGSFTDATGINIHSLTREAQQKLKEAYFSETGLEYNLFRVPIGGSDYSTRAYSYDDNSDGDFEFKNFTLQMEDYQYKIPLIREAQNMSKYQIKLLATSWSPPAWMKTSNTINGLGWLKGETGGQYYVAMARYYLRFLKEYQENGIKFWGLTTQNEPETGLIPFYPFNDLGMTPDMLQIFVKNLGRQLRASEFNSTKLLIYDYERISLLPYVTTVLDDEEAYQYADGIANHWYSDNIMAPFVLDIVHDKYPQKPMLMTEACLINTFTQFGKPVSLGSWQRAETYAYYIIQNLQHWITGWIDWNMALNLQGGPNWANNFVDAPIIVNNLTNEFYKQPLYYVMGHFSKFIPPGSVVIGTKQSWFSRGISSVAFKTPESTIVLIVLNSNNKDVSVKIKDLNVGSFQAEIPSKALITFIWAKQ